VVTAGDDGHADHRAAYAIASGLDVQRIYAYPISARYDGVEYCPPVGAVCIPPRDGDVKRAAIARHGSQTEAGGVVYPLTATTLDRFCTEPEMFIPVRTPPQ
jgi:LmbE family N-acetylglucosaminyl deacetylase